jgi:hypothetical protein
MTMVFDRQDSRALGLDNAPGSPSKDTGVVPGIGGGSPLLIPLSETAITSTPGNPCADPAFKAFTQGCSPDSYFLGTSATPKYGYYVTFPIPMSPAAPASTFLSKGINPPIVVANTLSYDYFTPLTSDPCTGGTGNTYTWFISDVLHPIVNDLRPGMLAPSGGVLPVWSGVASNFMAIGNGVLQAGQVAGAGANGASAAELNNHMVNASSRYPAVKVWRTVQ